MSRTKDDPWTPKKRERNLIPLAVILPTFTCIFPEFTLPRAWSTTHTSSPTDFHGNTWVDNRSPLQARASQLGNKICNSFKNFLFFYLACSSHTINQALYHVAVTEQICLIHIPYKELLAKTLWLFALYFKVYKKRHFSLNYDFFFQKSLLRTRTAASLDYISNW